MQVLVVVIFKTDMRSVQQHPISSRMAPLRSLPMASRRWYAGSRPSFSLMFKEDGDALSAGRRGSDARSLTR